MEDSTSAKGFGLGTELYGRYIYILRGKDFQTKLLLAGSALVREGYCNADFSGRIDVLKGVFMWGFPSIRPKMAAQ
jgi:hypothetical protein